MEVICPKCFVLLFIYEFPSYPHSIHGEQIPPTPQNGPPCMSHDSVLLDTAYWIRYGQLTGARSTWIWNQDIDRSCKFL